MDKLAVQSRYTRINSWYRAPRLIRFSDRLVQQMIKGGGGSARSASGEPGPLRDEVAAGGGPVKRQISAAI
jgi:hypothetical protein